MFGSTLSLWAIASCSLAMQAMLIMYSLIHIDQLVLPIRGCEAVHWSMCSFPEIIPLKETNSPPPASATVRGGVLSPLPTMLEFSWLHLVQVL